MNKTLIGYLLEMLAVVNFRGASEEVQIAKGKYELPLTFKGLIRKLKKSWR